MLTPEELTFLEKQVQGLLALYFVERADDESYNSQRDELRPLLGPVFRLRHQPDLNVICEVGPCLKEANQGTQSYLGSDLVDTVVAISDAITERKEDNVLQALVETNDIRYLRGFDQLFGWTEWSKETKLKDYYFTLAKQPKPNPLILQWLHRHQPLQDLDLFMRALSSKDHVELARYYLHELRQGEPLVQESWVLGTVAADKVAFATLLLEQLEADCGHEKGKHKALPIVTECLQVVQSTAMLKVLLLHGAVPKKAEGCLHIAVDKGLMDVAEELIACGVPPNDLFMHHTALCFAARRNFVQHIPRLVEELKVPIRVVEGSEKNPLSFAPTSEMLGTLLKHGAQITRFTLLDAVQALIPVDVLKVLLVLSRGFFVKDSMVEFKNPSTYNKPCPAPEVDVALFYALENDAVTLAHIDLLLEQGANPRSPFIYHYLGRWCCTEDKFLKILKYHPELESRKKFIESCVRENRWHKAQAVIDDDEKQKPELEEHLFHYASSLKQRVQGKYNRAITLELIESDQDPRTPVKLPLLRLALMHCFYEHVYEPIRTLYLKKAAMIRFADIPAEWKSRQWYIGLPQRVFKSLERDRCYLRTNKPKKRLMRGMPV